MDTQKNNNHKKQIPEATINEIIKLYTEEKIGYTKIAKQFNLSSYLIHKILKEKNIAIRNHQQANELISAKRRYKFNENFFEVESAEMAWLLGFTAADGCVSKNNSIIWLLAQKDKEILIKIHKLLGCEEKINIKEYVDSNGQDCCRLHLTSRIACDSLAKYNIVPRKTFSFTFPTQLNKKYWLDFIRGYWDGDGWISKNNNGLIWGIVSARKEVLETISKFFVEFGLKDKKIYERIRNGSVNYYLQYSTKETIKIYELLYKDAPIALNRKFLHFLEIYNDYKNKN